MTDLLTVRVRWPMRSRGAMIALRFFTRERRGLRCAQCCYRGRQWGISRLLGRR